MELSTKCWYQRHPMRNRSLLAPLDFRFCENCSIGTYIVMRFGSKPQKSIKNFFDLGAGIMPPKLDPYFPTTLFQMPIFILTSNSLVCTPIFTKNLRPSGVKLQFL